MEKEVKGYTPQIAISLTVRLLQQKYPSATRLNSPIQLINTIMNEKNKNQSLILDAE